MSSEIIIERSFALGYLVVGLSIFLNPQNLVSVMAHLWEGATPLIAGIMTVFLGAFMVVGHNVWEPSIHVITTIIAWMALIKGFVYMTYPCRLKFWSAFILKRAQWLRPMGLIVMGLGGLIFWGSF